MAETVTDFNGYRFDVKTLYSLQSALALAGHIALPSDHDGDSKWT